LPIVAELLGQLDPQSLAVQSVGVLIGSPSLIAGKLPLALGVKCRSDSGFRVIKSNRLPRGVVTASRPTA
jgi:hypothetical protein